jgi:hypothetical protein
LASDEKRKGSFETIMKRDTKKTVDGLDCNNLQVNIVAVRLAKTKAFIHVETPSGNFTITTTKESAKRLMKA